MSLLSSFAEGGVVGVAPAGTDPLDGFTPIGVTTDVKVTYADDAIIGFSVPAGVTIDPRKILGVTPLTDDHMAVATVVHRALVALGRTPMQVAKTLYDAGIRGIKEDSVQCPLARFIRTLDVIRDGGWMTNVYTHGVDIYRADGNGFTIRCPGPVRGFIAGFDHNHHRGLIDEPVTV